MVEPLISYGMNNPDKNARPKLTTVVSALMILRLFVIAVIKNAIDKAVKTNMASEIMIRT